ncbi:MAG: RcpC/CpaB family pilus assembly protein [Desulfobacteraceae bacterium]|jgi:Flp pilus assembly protein CpaB
MRNFRGIIALALSIILGLIAAKAVFWYLNKPKTVEKPVKIAAPKPQKALIFSEKIPEGMRIIAIKLDRDSGIPTQLDRGDLVDVAVTSKIPDKNGASVTRIILEGIEIYDPGNSDSEKKRSNRQEERTVSLLVTPQDAITILASKESAKINLIARNNSDQNSAGELTTGYTLEKGVEKIDQSVKSFSGSLPAGMRAITLAVSDTDGILGVLESGDRVDVIATCPYGKFTSNDLIIGSEGTITATTQASTIIIQDVEVLATEKTISALPIGEEKPALRVTLLATPDQAVKLSVITDSKTKNVIRLISRNPDDHSRKFVRQELRDMIADQIEGHKVEIYRKGILSHKNFYHDR